MEVEQTVESYLNEAVEEEQEQPRKRGADATPPSTTNGCFDCNICLDFAVEPVVTLCGHLYCWPCIYKWLQVEMASPQQCPVCKASLSEDSLVPLYGRGHTTKSSSSHQSLLDIPRRPSSVHHRDNNALLAQPESPRAGDELYHRALQRAEQQQHYHHHHHHHYPPNASYISSSSSSSSPRGLLGGMAIAVLPWVLGNHEEGFYQSDPYYVMSTARSPRLRRQEMQVVRSLRRLSVFLFCCVILCLLLF